MIDFVGFIVGLPRYFKFDPTRIASISTFDEPTLNVTTSFSSRPFTLSKLLTSKLCSIRCASRSNQTVFSISIHIDRDLCSPSEITLPYISYWCILQELESHAKRLVESHRSKAWYWNRSSQFFVVNDLCSIRFDLDSIDHRSTRSLVESLSHSISF